MMRVRRWTTIGGVLLCLGALACEDDDDPSTGSDRDSAETGDAGAGGAANGGGSQGGGSTDRDGDGELDRDAGSGEGSREAGGGGDPEADEDAGGGPGASDDASGGDAGLRLSDPEIGHVTSTANKGEIDQANAALPKLSNAQVRAFANHMIEAHSAAQARQTALLQGRGITPAPNALSAELEMESAAIIAQLQGAANAEADRLYIDTQVMVHTKVLKTLDEVLIPSAQDAMLKSELMTTRGEVKAHLDQATMLASSLSG